MTEAMQLSKESVSAPLPPGEGGITFGVPLETFKRKVCAVQLRSCHRLLCRDRLGTQENCL